MIALMGRCTIRNHMRGPCRETTENAAASIDHRRRPQAEGSLRRLLAIGFAAKESSDVDDPHDHSVANAIVRSVTRRMMKAIMRGILIIRARQGSATATPSYSSRLSEDLFDHSLAQRDRLGATASRA